MAAIAAALSFAATPLHAQTPPAAATVDPQSPHIAEAREAFRIGSALAKQAQWVDALAAFERSARLRPHAVTTYNIGFCERALGRFTRARKSLSRALAAPANELPAELATEARGYLAEIDRRLARAVITLTKTGALVSVDGRPLEAAGGAVVTAHPELVAGTREPGPAEPVSASAFDLVIDPGTHVVVVSEPGSPDAVVTRDFAAGATIRLTLGPALAPKAAGPVKPIGWSPARRAGVIVSFSLAGAAAIAGGVLGGLALKDRSDLDRLCMQRDQCPTSAQGTIDQMKTFATLSTLSIAGAVGAATVGVVLIATGGESKPRAATATPWIGPGSIGIRGSF
jgi:hypothetical protein